MSIRSFQEEELVEVLSWGFKGKIIKKRLDKRGINLYDVISEEDGAVVVCRAQEMVLRKEKIKDEKAL